MTLEQVRKLVRARPFQPFEVHMADGRSLLVDHPDFVIVPPDGRTVFAYDKLDRWLTVIDLLLVSSLEVRTDGAAS